MRSSVDKTMPKILVSLIRARRIGRLVVSWIQDIWWVRGWGVGGDLYVGSKVASVAAALPLLLLCFGWISCFLNGILYTNQYRHVD